MQAWLRPKGQLLAASPALGAVAWPCGKGRVVCEVLPGTETSRAVGVGDAASCRSIHDLHGVQECAFLQWQSGVDGNGHKKREKREDNGNDKDDNDERTDVALSSGVVSDILAAASRTAVDVLIVSRTFPDEKGGGVLNVIQTRALELPQDANPICSLAWRPASFVPSLSPATVPAAQIVVVTKLYALLYTIDADLVSIAPPLRVSIPVSGAPTLATFAGDALALCGGGEFSLHSLDLIMSPPTKGGRRDDGESTCLCADLASASPTVHLGAPCSLAHMLSMSSVDTDLFICLTDSPVSLPFASGKRDRPLNEALHMMQTVRSRKKDNASTGNDVKMTASDEHNNGTKNSTGETSTANWRTEGKDSQADQVIDLVGGFNQGRTLPNGNPGGTLGALMSIRGRSGGTVAGGGILRAASMLDGSSSGVNPVEFSFDSSTSVSSSISPNDTAERQTPAPCLNIYRLKSGVGKNVMRVSVRRVPLINGDIMTVCARTGLVAVGSGTCSQIIVFRPSMPGYRLKVFKKIDLKVVVAGSKQKASSVMSGEEAGTTTAAPAGVPPATSTLSVRCKGLSFVNADLWVLVGVKSNQDAGFFSAGATRFVCELRHYRFGDLVDPPAPVPDPVPALGPAVPKNVHLMKTLQDDDRSSVSATDTIVQAIESMRIHMDSRLDRIEGSLLIHSQRLSKIETVIAASR